MIVLRVLSVKSTNVFQYVCGGVSMMLQSLLWSNESDCVRETERCDSAQVGPCALTHTGRSIMN